MKQIRVPSVVEASAEPVDMKPALTHEQVAAVYSYRNPKEKPLTRAHAEFICRRAMNKLRKSDELLLLMEGRG